MAIFIVVLGFILVVMLPMAACIFILPQLSENDWKRGTPMFFAIPGLLMIGIGLYNKKEDKPIMPSQACGVVQFYKTYKVRRRAEFERISIRFDDAEYSRHLLFNERLARPNKTAHVCFEYLDKFKYPHLSESTLLKWIEPTEMQTIIHADQIK